MDEYRCPVAAENKDAHAKFREQFGSFYQEWQSGNLSPTLAEETYKELENWLLYHIARTDTRLRSCVIK
jgi:hemerythrin